MDWSQHRREILDLIESLASNERDCDSQAAIQKIDEHLDTCYKLLKENADKCKTQFADIF